VHAEAEQKVSLQLPRPSAHARIARQSDVLPKTGFLQRPGMEQNTPSPLCLMVLIRCSTDRQSEAFGPHVQDQFVTAWCEAKGHLVTSAQLSL